jgi:hypothetical protein
MYECGASTGVFTVPMPLRKIKKITNPMGMRSFCWIRSEIIKSPTNEREKDGAHFHPISFLRLS